MTSPKTPQNIAPSLATLAGGCFWCLEAVFVRLSGVLSVRSGYCGGQTPHPSYEDVCTGKTGHAEAVEITFDPQQITYCDLLNVFFAIHDPTTMNRQGNDVGTQYRSAIFTHSADQATSASEVVTALEFSGGVASPIVTEILEATTFYPAEDYHQNYYAGQPFQPYCQAIIAPKLARLRANFASKLK